MKSKRIRERKKIEEKRTKKRIEEKNKAGYTGQDGAPGVINS